MSCIAWADNYTVKVILMDIFTHAFYMKIVQSINSQNMEQKCNMIDNSNGMDFKDMCILVKTTNYHSYIIPMEQTQKWCIHIKICIRNL